MIVSRNPNDPESERECPESEHEAVGNQVKPLIFNGFP
jgi:hypothetical protein